MCVNNINIIFILIKMSKYSEEYIKSIYNIFQMVNKMPQTESKKTKYIALLIFKYIFSSFTYFLLFGSFVVITSN